MKVNIERYNNMHFDELCSVIEQVLREYEFEFGIGSLRGDLIALSNNQAYKESKEAFWVARDGDKVIGSIALRSRDDGLAELKRFYLLSEYRGAGIGSKLYDVAEQFAIDKGYEGIWLESSRRFKSAEKLYKKKGYRLLEAIDNEWEDNFYEKKFKECSYESEN